MVACGAVFEPDEIKLMRSGLDEAAIILPKTERTSAVKVRLALRILSAAANGERDPNKLRIAALMPEGDAQISDTLACNLAIHGRLAMSKSPLAQSTDIDQACCEKAATQFLAGTIGDGRVFDFRQCKA
jgi:hypothetical protein